MSMIAHQKLKITDTEAFTRLDLLLTWWVMKVYIAEATIVYNRDTIFILLLKVELYILQEHYELL